MHWHSLIDIEIEESVAMAKVPFAENWFAFMLQSHALNRSTFLYNMVCMQERTVTYVIWIENWNTRDEIHDKTRPFFFFLPFFFAPHTPIFPSYSFDSIANVDKNTCITAFAERQSSQTQ